MKLVLVFLLSCSVCWASVDDNSLPDWMGEDAKPKPCCLPKRWRGVVGEIGGYGKKDRAGTGRIVAEVFSDMDAGKAACFETVWIDGKPHHKATVADYNDRTMYITHGGKCFKRRLPASKRTQCMPEGAKYLGSPTIGWGDSAMKVNGFKYTRSGEKGDVFTEMIVTPDGCAPISESGILHARDPALTVLFNFAFFNLKSDIPDSSVFDPPRVCENATLYDSDTQLSHVQNYLFNIKFTM